VIAIPLLSMYSREFYEAAEAYASDRSNRDKYDSLVEAATKTANEYLADSERRRKEGEG
jgi:hypothetical protein